MKTFPADLTARFGRDGDKASLALKAWLEASKISHNGEFRGENGIIAATQRHCQRFDPTTGLPLKRSQLDFPKEDAKVQRSDRELRLRCLRKLGLFDYGFTPQPNIDTLLFHANHLAELALMYKLLVWLCDKKRVSYHNIIFLGAACSVGQSNLSANELADIIANLDEHPYLLHNNYPGALRWYAPNSQIFAAVWKQLPMPTDMAAVPFHLVSAPDRVGPDNTRILANTNDTFDSLAQSGLMQKATSIGVVTTAPIARRQLIITKKFLDKYCPGCTVAMICAHYAGPASLTLCEREAANTLWEDDQDEIA